jgi:hypothetical protein
VAVGVGVAVPVPLGNGAGTTTWLPEPLSPQAARTAVSASGVAKSIAARRKENGDACITGSPEAKRLTPDVQIAADRAKVGIRNFQDQRGIVLAIEEIAIVADADGAERARFAEADQVEEERLVIQADARLDAVGGKRRFHRPFQRAGHAGQAFDADAPVVRALPLAEAELDHEFRRGSGACVDTLIL